MKATPVLYCDDCGCLITDPHDAELAWDWNDEERKRVLLVHAPYACPRWQHRRRNLPEPVRARGTINLEYYLGSPGLLELLADIEKGDFPVEVGLELIRRLHVPGYEESLRS